MAHSSHFIDDYPCDLSARNSEAHRVIDAELRNCDSCVPNSPAGIRFPACATASSAQRRTWFSAAMERVEWHCQRRQPGSEKWLLHLTCLLRMLVRDSGPLEEETLLRLARFGPRLHLNRGGSAHFHDLIPAVAKALSGRKAPFTPELATALNGLVDHLIGVHDHSSHTFEIAFRLFRAGWTDIPWIWLSELSSPEWNSLLGLADHNWQFASNIAPKQAAWLADAIAKIGAENVASFITRTVEAMAACQPTPLSAAGMTMLRQMLTWAQVRPELAVDEALKRLCSIQWEPAVTKSGLMKEWLGALLAALAVRGRERTLVAVERLANNPDTKSFRQVQGLYEQYMDELLQDVLVAPTHAIDGYPIDSDAHRILDSFERASLPRPNAAGGSALQSTGIRGSEHIHVTLRHAGNDFPGMLRAMNQRVHWLAKQEPAPAERELRSTPWLHWCCDFGRLYCLILERKPVLSAADLAALCKVDALGWLGGAPTGPILDACEFYISQHGFDAELTNAMEEWQKTVFGGGTAMSLRKQIGWLLWFDTTAAINEAACWSAIIRKDLRTMPDEMRNAWTELLRNACFALAEKPTKKWLKPAEKLLAQVGAAEFRMRVRMWFAPFAAGRELKITVAGRDILGALLWYSQLAKDPKVDEAARWFGTAKWKAKADRDRTARLLPIWIHTMKERCPEHAVDAIHAYRATGQLDLKGTSMELYRELCRRYGREEEIAAPPPAAPVAQDVTMAKMMQKAMKCVLGGAAELTGDTLVVSNSGDGECYEIGVRDGRILRVSDGKAIRLEIDWSRPWFSPFKSMIDSGDLENPFAPNYLRAMFCAQVLSGQLPSDLPLVVDES